MDIEELLCAGSDILEDVVQAINTNNYSDLGQKIRDRVKEATLTVTPADHKQKTSRPRTGYTQNQGSGTARGQNAGPRTGNASAQSAGPRTGNASAQSAGPRTGNTSGRNAGLRSGNVYGQNAGSRTGYMSGRGGTAQSAAPRQPVYTLRGTGPKSRFLLRRLGKSGMTLQSVLGGIGIFFFGLQSLLCLVALFGTSGVNTVFSVIGLLIFGGLTLSCSMLLRGGLRGGKLIDRYYAYGGLLGDAEYASVPDLAAKTGLKPEEVRKDLQAMIIKGYLPQAKWDAQQSTLILTDHAYEMYRQAEENRVKRETEKQRREEEPPEEREIHEILDRGNEYIRKVRDVNDLIPDTEEMSAKLYRLEEIMHRIFEQVQKQPESAAGLRRFMDYYLPTTEKLLDAYVELDKQPVDGDNIVKTKQEIDEAMDVINDAFENLLNSLFQDMAWDISSDISVMKTMLAQDGLTRKEPLPR